MAKNDLTAQQLRALFHYDPDKGVFVRLVRAARYPKVGTPNTRGYLIIRIGKVNYRAARLAHLYMTGSWPINEMDHIDGDKANDKWENLRDVPKSINMQNQRKPRADNNCGHLGARLTKRGKYTAHIRSGGKTLEIGVFDSAEQAHAAYIKEKRRMHSGNTL